jgi:hypothetical protein
MAPADWLWIYYHLISSNVNKEYVPEIDRNWPIHSKNASGQGTMQSYAAGIPSVVNRKAAVSTGFIVSKHPTLLELHHAAPSVALPRCTLASPTQLDCPRCYPPRRACCKSKQMPHPEVPPGASLLSHNLSSATGYDIFWCNLLWSIAKKYGL